MRETTFVFNCSNLKPDWKMLFNVHLKVCLNILADSTLCFGQGSWMQWTANKLWHNGWWDMLLLRWLTMSRIMSVLSDVCTQSKDAILILCRFCEKFAFSQANFVFQKNTLNIEMQVSFIAHIITRQLISKCLHPAKVAGQSVPHDPQLLYI